MTRRIIEVTFKGAADESLVERFDCLKVIVEHGATRLHIPGADPAVLHGTVRHIDALGLELLSVCELNEWEGAK